MGRKAVSKAHIDLLLDVAIVGPEGAAHWRSRGDGRPNEKDGTRLGRVLLHANRRGLVAEYGEKAVLDWGIPDPEAYEYTPRRLALSVAECHKILRYYEYQCEHDPDWEGSEARAFCNDLGIRFVGFSGFYDEDEAVDTPAWQAAPWGWSEEEIAKARDADLYRVYRFNETGKPRPVGGGRGRNALAVLMAVVPHGFTGTVVQKHFAVAMAQNKADTTVFACHRIHR